MKNDEDETAFPVPIGRVETDRLGMSLRDIFALGTLIGIHAKNEYDDIDYDDFAITSYRQADAMMEARKKYG